MFLQRGKSVVGLGLVCLYLNLALVASIGPVNSYLPNLLFPPDQITVNFVDLLNARLEDIQNELKSASEQLGGLETQLSLLRKATTQLETVILEELETEDGVQSDMLDHLSEHIRQGLRQRTREGNMCNADVEQLNEQNNNDTITTLQNLSPIAWQNNDQDVTIARLSQRAKDFRQILNQELGNEFGLVNKDVGSLAGALALQKEHEREKTCETGVVTLDSDDRRGEYLFQTAFQTIPQVSFSLSCYDFNLNAHHTDDFHYWGYFFKQPNAIGVYISAHASRNGVTFEKSNLSFGDTANQKVCVSFQACTIGTGMD